MYLVIALFISYIPFFIWAASEAINQHKPLKREYETSKINDYWVR